MAITYAGTGGLFTRLGKLFFLASKIDAFQGEVITQAGDVVTAFDTPDMWQIPALIDLATGHKAFLPTRDAVGSAISTNNMSSMSAMYMNSLHGIIANTAQLMVKEAVRTGLDLSVGSNSAALTALIRDMVTLGHKVDENTVGAASLASISGNTSTIGTVITSQSMPAWQMGGLAKKWQTTKVEAIEIKCTSDESTGAGAGAESFSVIGKSAYHKFTSLWPDGSGARGTIPVTAAGGTRNTDNLLYNSDFNIWTAATACDKWTFSVASGNALSHTAGGQGGALGNDTERTTTTFGSRGTYNLQINGNNSCSHLIQQKMGNTTDGTIGTVRPNTSIVFSLRLKSHTTTITSGVIRVALWNAASGRVSGASTTLDFSSSNLTSAWTHLYGVWDLTDKSVPVDLRLGIDFSTVLQADRSVQIGELILHAPTSAYPGGPGFTVVRGVNDFRLTDGFNVTFANNNASDMQMYFDKYLNTSNSGLNLPVAGSGTAFTDSGYIT